jgi:hypothetical protein
MQQNKIQLTTKHLQQHGNQIKYKQFFLKLSRNQRVRWWEKKLELLAIHLHKKHLTHDSQAKISKQSNPYKMMKKFKEIHIQ